MPTVPQRQETPPPRRRGKVPLWMNATLGVVIILAGIFFFLFGDPRMGVGGRAALLAGYLLIGAFYLRAAFRQRREKRAERDQRLPPDERE